MFKKIVGATILTAALFMNPLISEAKKDFIMEGPVYMKVNIHYQNNGKDSKASYANYTNPGAGHKIVTVNTPVQIKSWKRKGFIIVNTETNEEIYFEYSEERMQMTAEEYLNKITSPAKVDLSKLSEKDLKGIKEGVASAGMTKDGVMMALGYPATHRTPSLESNTWVYWSNRFKTIAVTFDDKGIVTAIQ
ncbi:MAG: outer membrane protein assembly factor BamE [Deltaproteobacteria bacterium]|nr:outer membrane protein assembly factor BamE [Deltaproteobacteria bacterium]